jgi:hypothetical protein
MYVFLASWKETPKREAVPSTPAAFPRSNSFSRTLLLRVYGNEKVSHVLGDVWTNSHQLRANSLVLIYLLSQPRVRRRELRVVHFLWMTAVDVTNGALKQWPLDLRKPRPAVPVGTEPVANGREIVHVRVPRVIGRFAKHVFGGTRRFLGSGVSRNSRIELVLKRTKRFAPRNACYCKRKVSALYGQTWRRDLVRGPRPYLFRVARPFARKPTACPPNGATLLGPALRFS